MPIRQEPFATGEYYHIFNRGVDRSAVFRNSRDYQSFLAALEFYRYKKPDIRFSAFSRMNIHTAEVVRSRLEQSGINVSVLAYAFMPNHFHLLVRQEAEFGIHQFLFKALNSFAKYLNTKHRRIGPVFQGNFQAVHIESDEQLLHVSRYIHLNPVVAGITTMQSLEIYPWTSYPYYVGSSQGWINTSEIIGMIGSVESYRTFVDQQEGYARMLSGMRHLMMDSEDLLTSEVRKNIEDKMADIL
jgi:putative transposase